MKNLAYQTGSYRWYYPVASARRSVSKPAMRDTRRRPWTYHHQVSRLPIPYHDAEGIDAVRHPHDVVDDLHGHTCDGPQHGRAQYGNPRFWMWLICRDRPNVQLEHARKGGRHRSVVVIVERIVTRKEKGSDVQSGLLPTLEQHHQILRRIYREIARLNPQIVSHDRPLPIIMRPWEPRHGHGARFLVLFVRIPIYSVRKPRQPTQRERPTPPPTPPHRRLRLAKRPSDEFVGTTRPRHRHRHAPRPAQGLPCFSELAETGEAVRYREVWCSLSERPSLREPPIDQPIPHEFDAVLQFERCIDEVSQSSTYL